MAWETSRIGSTSANCVSWYYTPWKNQHDTVKGISTIFKTPVCKPLFICSELWHTRVKQALGFLLIWFFLLLLFLSFSKLQILNLWTHCESFPSNRDGIKRVPYNWGVKQWPAQNCLCLSMSSGKIGCSEYW